METRKFIQEIIDNELTMCFADCSQDNIEKWIEILERFKKQLTLTGVGCSFSIGFAQYIAKEHYTLVNQIGNIHYWRNEEFSKTTEQLLKDYKETLT